MERPSRSDRILEAWAEAADHARPPLAPRGVVTRSSLPLATLVGAAALAVVVLAAGSWLGRGTPNGVTGSSPSPQPQSSTAAVSPSAPAVASPVAGSPTPAGPTPCEPDALAARITMWEGAAGQRIGHIELTNRGGSACIFETARWHPQLVDGSGAVLVDGKGTAARMLTIEPGAILTTLVDAGNYCGPEPTPPISVAFARDDGERVVASPVSPTDATVPPCNGQGAPATLEMQPWAR